MVFGNVIHSAPEDMYMARVVGMKAGIPKEVPAFTVNRLCGTGVQSIVSGAQAIQTGDADGGRRRRRREHEPRPVLDAGGAGSARGWARRRWSIRSSAA